MENKTKLTIDKKTIVIIILSIILVGAIGIYSYDKIVEESYNQGIQDATNEMNQKIIQSLQQNGYVPITYEVGGNTQIIKLIPEIGEE